MKDVFKITAALTITCLVCAFSLALVFNSAKGKIAYNTKKRINDAIVKLSPSADKIDKVNLKGAGLYKLFNKKRDFLGYAFIAEGQGYQGKIKILAVSGPFFKELEGIEVIDSVETPGLGAKIMGEWFKKQFSKVNILSDIECVKKKVKKNNQIQAITGATISSRSVVKILNNRIAYLRKVIKDR